MTVCHKYTSYIIIIFVTKCRLRASEDNSNAVYEFPPTPLRPRVKGLITLTQFQFQTQQP